jgi:hypothetical protein
MLPDEPIVVLNLDRAARLERDRRRRGAASGCRCGQSDPAAGLCPRPPDPRPLPDRPAPPQKRPPARRPAPAAGTRPERASGLL